MQSKPHVNIPCAYGMCDSAYWIGQVAKRYNAQGPEGMKNRQHTTSRRTAPLLSVELQPAEHLCPLTNTAITARIAPTARGMVLFMRCDFSCESSLSPAG